MAYKITDDCISCGACAADCPVDAIKEGDGKYVIDEAACISCGACAGSWTAMEAKPHLTHSTYADEMLKADSGNFYWRSAHLRLAPVP